MCLGGSQGGYLTSKHIILLLIEREADVSLSIASVFAYGLITTMETAAIPIKWNQILCQKHVLCPYFALHDKFFFICQ